YFGVDVTEEDAEGYTNIIVSMESKSNHPLAQAIIQHYDSITPEELEVENIIGIGLIAKKSDQTYKIGKPSSYDIVPEDIQKQTSEFENDGKTVVYFGTD